MNERDETLVRLFAGDEPDTNSEAFAAAVHERVAWQRLRARALELVLAAAGVAVVGAVLFFVPEAVLYPVQLVSSLMSWPIGALACAVGVVGIAWWSRFGEA